MCYIYYYNLTSDLDVSSVNCYRHQWPRGLRHGSAAARLLRLWVRIPSEVWMSDVNGVCCQVEVSATS